MSADTITDKNSSGIQQLDKSPSSTISVEIPAQQNMDPQVVSLEDVETNDISTASSLENPSDPQMGTHFVSPDVTTLTHSSSDSEIRDKKTGFMSLPDELMDDPEIIKIKVYVPNTPYDRKYRLPRARWRSGNTPYNYHVRYGKVSNIIVNSNKYLFEVAPENVIFSTDQFAPSILAVLEWEYSDDEKYLEDEDRGQLDVQSNVPEVTRSQDSIKDEDITFRDFFETLAIIVACFVSLSALIDYGLFAFLAWLGFEFDDTGYNCGADLDLVLDLLPYGMPSGQERI
ncbi:hypothetical protein ACEPPN_014336 [Leptodophora sp. 'Broadleaf-Isolate-01']